MSEINIGVDSTKTIVTTRNSIMGLRRAAWQTIGTTVNGLMTADEVIKAAGLDSPVTKQPCFAFVNGEYVEVENRWVTGRQEKNFWQPYATVGEQYAVIQDAEQFQILDDIRDASDAAYETVGKLDKGARTFITMKLPESLEFNGGEDKVDLYLFATNSHDGSSSFTIGITPLRLACTNQLTAMVQNARRVIRMKHTKNINLRIDEARQALGLTFRYVESFEHEVQKMIRAEMTDKGFETFARDYTGYGSNEPDSRKETVAQKSFEQLLNLWKADTQLVAGRNYWSAYNAVAEYVDWFSGTRKQKATSDEEARALRTLSGNADAAKQRAWDLLHV